MVRRDPDGYYWSVGRADDIIKTAGHLVSPFEVESVLMDHPAVSEAAVIGTPDPLIGAPSESLRYAETRPGRQ